MVRRELMIAYGFEYSSLLILRKVAIESGKYDSMKNLRIPFQIKVSSKYFCNFKNL